MSLSVCLIVKDEEEVIARALSCASKFADEIIIADTGSTDKTVELAQAFTDKIYHFDWINDFSAARNFAFEKASCDYVMWLDADDEVTEENCKKIRELIARGDFDMAFLKYAAAFEDGEPTFVYYRERIFRRSMNYRFSGCVHEAVAPRGRIVYSDAAVYHKKVKAADPMRNLGIYQNMIARHICLDERSKFYYSRELSANGMYRESAAVSEDFLNGDGWVENKIEACFDLYYAYTALGDDQKAVDSLLRSLKYAPPRSRFCCILGGLFLDKNELNSAIYWYQRALESAESLESGAFVNLDFCGFIPLMQLCVIYDKLGEYKKAEEYNEAAGKIKPNSSSYLSNKNTLQQN